MSRSIAIVSASPLPAAGTALVVEDDPIVREIVVATLASQGIASISVGSVAAGLAADRTIRADLVIADVNLPDGLGFDLVSTLRRRHEAPVIYLTSRGAMKDRLRGFATGADDYLIKPFDPAELAARVLAVLRRVNADGRNARLIAHGDWTLDLVRRELASSSGTLVALTRGEFDLLSALVQAAPTALDRTYLLEVVSSVETTAGPRTIDVMVSRIRAKLHAMGVVTLRIGTVHGKGYRAESDP